MSIIIGVTNIVAGRIYSLLDDDDFILQSGFQLVSTGDSFLNADDSVAIWSTTGGHELYLDGTVSGNIGVQLGDSGSDLGNEVTVGSLGSITGRDGDGLAVVGGQARIVNRGLIAGSGDGVSHVASQGMGSTLLNTGTILGGFGVFHSGSERFSLTNSGVIKGLSGPSYLGSSGVDVVVNKGFMNRAVVLNAGNDFYDGRGGRIDGNVLGDAGADRLIGGSFADKLQGGQNNDTLTGGLGADQFGFQFAPNTATNRDLITDFNAPADSIHLDMFGFAAIVQPFGVLLARYYWESATGLAHDGDDHIIYNTTTGALTYDSNGSAPGGAQQFAVLQNHAAIGASLSHLDFFLTSFSG